MLYLSEQVDESALPEAVGDGRVEGQSGVRRGEELDPLLRHPSGHQVHLVKKKKTGRQVGRRAGRYAKQSSGGHSNGRGSRGSRQQVKTQQSQHS